MQTFDGLNSDKTSIIRFSKSDILKKIKGQNADIMGDTPTKDLFTDGLYNDIIDNNKTLDNHTFIKWFCEYNERLNQYAEEINKLKEELLEKNILIEKLKEGIYMDGDVKFLFQKFDKLDQKFDKINEKFDRLGEKFDNKIDELRKDVGNISINIGKGETSLEVIKDDIKEIKDSKKFRIRNVIVPIIVGIITGVIGGTIAVLFGK